MNNIELDKLPDESKYYIPTIEEFHVGFNYEIWEKKLVYDKVWKFRVNKYIFNEKQVTQTFFNYNFTEDLREDKIRVKLLDKEDIESLGWDTDDNGQCYNKTSGFTLYGLYPWEDTNEYKITIEMNTVFLGIIKNKSELIKLLKQLKIE